MNAIRLAAPLLAATLAACGNGQVASDPVRPVLTTVVAPGAATTGEVYSGEIRARHEADVGFRVAGKLIARPADAGARVARGQVLARLDPEDAKLAAGAARAALGSAEGDFTLAKAERDRHADLLAKRFISQSAFDVRENALNAAKARLEQVRSQSAITENQAGYTTLVADADGVVVSVAAEPGQVVAAGQPVLRIARAGEKEVEIAVPESQLSRFKVGNPVAVHLWAHPGQPFAGRVREVAGGADPATRTYGVRITALNPPQAAQLGMTASVLLQQAIDPALVVLPMTALSRSASDPAVWVVEPSTSQVALRLVKVGQYREDGVTITSGLQAGERVVVAGVHKLRAGQKVRIAEAPKVAGAKPQ